jgi:hypothetical protein
MKTLRFAAIAGTLIALEVLLLIGAACFASGPVRPTGYSPLVTRLSFPEAVIGRDSTTLNCMGTL